VLVILRKSLLIQIIKPKLIKISLITLVLLSLVIPNGFLGWTENQVAADDSEIIQELLSEGFSIPGRTERTGTYFEIKDSEYLNITLKSTEEIEVILESIPRMISMDIGSSTDSTSTNLTIGGLEPNKTYYKYQDSYKNEAIFISDENGGYGWSQDLTQSHYVWIQEIKGTTFIDEDTVLDHDITGSVEITANNITLDCNGHNITGLKTGYGIFLMYKNNVIIKNCNVNQFSYGVFLASGTSLSNVINNNISENYTGMRICSFQSAIVNNKVLNNIRGIHLSGPGNNKIRKNEIYSNNTGIFLEYSSNNTVTENNIIANIGHPNTGYGIFLYFGAHNNIITNNTFDLNGLVAYFAYNNKVESNTVNGKPLVYLENVSNYIVGDAGQVVAINCDSITIEGFDLSNSSVGVEFFNTSNSKIISNIITNNLNGIYLTGSSSNNIINDNNITLNNRGIYLGGWGYLKNITITKNNISNNNIGLRISGSSNNHIIDNKIASNTECGMYFWWDAKDSLIYHDNFLNNSTQICCGYYGCGRNFFDNGYSSGGNYWSDYTGVDLYSGPNQDQPGSDGIGDTPYTFYGGQDRYPFIQESGWEVIEIPDEFWVETKKDGECIYQEESLTTKLKCLPQGWILKVPNPGKKYKSWNDVPTTTQIIDATDGVSGWTNKEWLNYEAEKQEEWKDKTERLDPSKNPNEGGTVPAILEAVNRYYNNTSSIKSLYSSNDVGNHISVLKENWFPIELILAIAAQESGASPFNFNNELMTYDYGHGIMQITLKGIKFDIKYLQIILNSDPETQVAKFGPGSPGNETHHFGDRTENAVIRFQEKYCKQILEPILNCSCEENMDKEKCQGTGIVGPSTRSKLNEILENNRGIFLDKGISSHFKFEDFLRKGFSDVIDENATLDNRGIGSRLKILPCADILNPDSQNYFKECYRYYGGKEYKEYEPHQYYNNQVFKYYTNTPQGIYTNIKDGLRILQWNYIDSLSKNINSTDIIQWAGAVWRYNHGSPRRVIEKGDEYLARIADKLELDVNVFDILEEYFGNYKNRIPNNKFLDEVKRKAVVEKFKNYKTGEIKSPAELRVYDSQGRVTGVVEGEIKNEIPDSDFYNNTFIIYTPSDSYLYRVIGTEKGDYGLILSSVESGEINSFNATEISISQNTIHQYQIDWQILSQGEKGVTVNIDLEGDGIFDQTVSAGKEFHIEKTNLSYQGDTSGYFSDSINLKAVLTDESGNGIPNKEIIFTIGTQTATSTTNENGIATTTLELKLIPKELIETYLLKVLFPGDDSYLISKDKIDFTLKSAKWLKQEAISELKAAKTDDKRTDKKIDKIIWFLNQGLNEALWQDASHLVFFGEGKCKEIEKLLRKPLEKDKLKLEEIKSKCPKAGISVFHYEKVAVRLMMNEIRFKKNPDELKIACENVIEKLVKSDLLLAKVSLFEAKNTEVQNPKFKKIISHLIKRAERELTRANKELERKRPDKAIMWLSHSWLYSQLAIKFANKK